MQIKRKKISAKLTKEGGNFAKFTRERTYFNSDYSTSILMMGQIMNQVMPCNKEPSHNQLSYFGSRIISSFSCGNNSQRNHLTYLRDTVKTLIALRKWERKKHTTHFNFEDLKQYSCVFFTIRGRTTFSETAVGSV